MYKVDFFVEKLMLILEYDRDNYKSYDRKKEKTREKELLKHHAIVRFNQHASIPALFNATLKVKLGEVIRVYPGSKGDIKTPVGR